MSYNSQYNNPNNSPFQFEFQNQFLTFKDYAMQIQAEDLGQILNEPSLMCDWKGNFSWTALQPNTQRILLECESVAIEEISSYIRARYIMNEAIPQTQYFIGNGWAGYSSGATFFGKNLISYSEPCYLSSTTYSFGQRLSFCGNIFQVAYTGTTSAVTPVYSSITIAVGFNTPYSGCTAVLSGQPYVYVTGQDSLYFSNLPIVEWNQYQNYNQGNLVWYQDNIYQAKQNVQGTSPAQSQNLDIRYGIPSVQSFLGVYPDLNLNAYTLALMMPSVNTNEWSLYSGPVNSYFTGTTYYFSGVTPTNTTYWTKGDNRNPQIRMYCIDILLYHLYQRISPRNIPALRQERYNGQISGDSIQGRGEGGAIGWLMSVQKGKVNLHVPNIVPTQGGDILWGGYPKYNNAF